MTTDEIQKKIELAIKDSIVTMQGDGCNCSTVVVSSAFEGMSLLARQKMVLATVRENIDSGELHALTIKARTPEEMV
ncbi:MAG: BolA/IbaG family iron-sulfur metabolism protein [Proteobacteria bacterium]|nr:BolA/IbaG family iron-sulfur metabolism protein [Pseudomonadota bacterium]